MEVTVDLAMIGTWVVIIGVMHCSLLLAAIAGEDRAPRALVVSYLFAIIALTGAASL